MWSGLELGGFCTPAPATVVAPIAEAEFSPGDTDTSHIAVLAADPQTDNPYHNARLPADVDGDGVVTVRDGQALLAKLDQIFGSGDPRSFPPTPGLPDIPSADDAIYWDVSNDGRLSPLDMLLVVNELNRLVPSPDDVQMQVETFFGYAYVVVHAPLPSGVSIRDYGEVGQQDTTFFVNVTGHAAEENREAHGVPRTSWTYFYGLGELAPGDYVFHLNINGRPMRSETFSIADTQRPKASLSVSDVTAPTEWHQFTVTYTDNDAVQLASLDDNDVVVFGPNGYREKATLVSIDANADNSVCNVTYQIPASAASRDWSGNWNWPANGQYEVWLEGDQVWDTSQNAAEAAHLGTFWVDVLQWTPYVPSGADVQIVSGTRSTNARVELTFADTGYRVADWGPCRTARQLLSRCSECRTRCHRNPRAGADTRFLQLSARKLEPGTYSFRFLVHGQLVQHVRFTLGDNSWLGTGPGNPIWMVPVKPAQGWELPSSPRVEFAWIADRNADSATQPVLHTMGDSGQSAFRDPGPRCRQASRQRGTASRRRPVPPVGRVVESAAVSRTPAEQS
jgi:hypothetical protein